MNGKRPSATKAEVEKKNKEIRDYHDRGRESHVQSIIGVTVEQQAILLGWSETTLRKARQFAHPTTGYSEDRLDELCDLVLEHRPVFGTAHIGQLVTVPWPDREQLQRRCVEGNWSLRKLRSATAKLFAPRSFGGRRPDVQPDDVLDRLEKFAHAFSRLLDELKRSTKGQLAIIAGLPKDVRAWTKAAAPHLAKLRKAVIAKMEAIREGDDVW